MSCLLNIFPVASFNKIPQKSKLSFNPWEVKENDFPKDGDISEKLKFLLNYAVLAPSGHNTQPWLFKIVDNAIEIYRDKSRSLPIVDPQDRELIISCGAALFNLRLAIRYFGYEEIVEFCPDPQNLDLLAKINLGRAKLASNKDISLFKVIQERRTNRLDFVDEQLSPQIISELKLAANSQSTNLIIIPDDSREAVIDLIAKGDRLQMANPLFRQELAKWIRSGQSSSHDGIPAYAQGMNERLDIFAPIVSLAIRSFNIGKFQADKDQKIAKTAPLLVLINSKDDTVKNWLATGEALAHLMLQARVADIWTSFFNQPIELDELRPQLQTLFPKNGYPQILLRLGYAKETKPTPRRSINEVLRQS